MSLLSELDGLDRERPGEPFTVRVAGQVIAFRSPTELTWRDLVDGLRNFVGFVSWIGPDDEETVDLLSAMPVWKMQAVMRAYRVHHGLPVTTAQDSRLLHLLGKPEYRKAIQWDLHAIHGLDLNTEWRARRWRRLVDFIDGLPTHSHFAEAMSNDEELAEAILDQPDDGPPKKPTRRLSEFSADVEVLSVLTDRVTELINVTVASRGGKPRKVPPMPRPATAVQRVRSRRQYDKHKWTVARVYGQIGPEVKPPGWKPKT